MATQPNLSTSNGRHSKSAVSISPKSSVFTPHGVSKRSQQQRAIELKIAGWTYAAIGKELGCSRQYVQQHLVRPSIQTLGLLYARAKGHCEKCGEKIRAKKVGHVHHLELRTEVYNALANLLYICAPCHMHEHAPARVYFTELPPGPSRRAAAEAFIQPFMAHLAARYCIGCGKGAAIAGLCKNCREKQKTITLVKNHLAQWQRANAETSDHCLIQAIYTIRKHNLTPEDFGLPLSEGAACVVSPDAPSKLRQTPEAPSLRGRGESRTVCES